MTGVRLSVLAGLVVAAALTSACADSDPVAPTPQATATPAPAPTPAPTPTPTPTPPPAPTYTISGTVSETAPTTARRVSGVLVTASSGVSATTNSDGTFTLSGVSTGSQTLSFARPEFETRSMNITVSNSDVGGVQVNLSPTPRIVDTGAIDARIGPDDPSCLGTSRPCDVYPVGAHHDGRVEVHLTWLDDDTELDLEVRCNDAVVAESTRKGTLEELNERIPGGQKCELHVIHRGGGTQDYRIFLKYPY